MVTLRLPPKIERKLARAAKKHGSTKAAFVRDALLARFEEEQDFADAVRVMRRVQRGEEPIHTSDEVKRELGL